jgi:hypothetical protein
MSIDFGWRQDEDGISTDVIGVSDENKLLSHWTLDKHFTVEKTAGSHSPSRKWER